MRCTEKYLRTYLLYLFIFLFVSSLYIDESKKFINPSSFGKAHLFSIKLPFKIVLLIIGTFCGLEKRYASEMSSSHCKVTYLFLNM